jgi:hypothetical protein
MNKPDKTVKDNGRHRKIIFLSDICSDMYAKFYNLSEYFAAVEVTVLFKERVIFKQYISKKQRCSGIKIYKFCDMAGYT